MSLNELGAAVAYLSETAAISRRVGSGSSRLADAVDTVVAAATAVPDWRVLGGLVPGVINAAWLHTGDKVRLNKLDGVVSQFTVARRAGVVRFLFVTDTGQVRVERALDSEVLVLTPANGEDQ